MARKDIWKKEKQWYHYVGYALAILIVGYIAYSTYYYLSNVEKIDEFEVCYDDKCVKTFHIHADIHIELCGQTLSLPREHGPLSGAHTHKELNYIHFHERLDYDPKSGQLINDTALRLETFMNAFDLKFNNECIGQYCNGDMCPDGHQGILKMHVNGQPNMNYERYAWKDKDKIQILFN